MLWTGLFSLRQKSLELKEKWIKVFEVSFRVQFVVVSIAFYIPVSTYHDKLANLAYRPCAFCYYFFHVTLHTIC